jgi:hypothetical protein
MARTPDRTIDGIAWVVQQPGVEAQFVVTTRFGLRHVGSFEEFLAGLDVVGELCEFPFADWPRVSDPVVA